MRKRELKEGESKRKESAYTAYTLRITIKLQHTDTDSHTHIHLSLLHDWVLSVNHPSAFLYGS